ncbi:MAG: hypothetical protein CIT01_00090 [Methanobacterium sp. BRmetb2]|nr:MAG: hypothetical protein CIT01_00090 [Methanobacterium sp. BRmetb2]
MDTVKRITKNIGMSGISQLVVSILAFVLLIYIARYFGPAEFGVYSFAVSFTALFAVFADIGISQFMIRDIARNKKLTAEYITNVSIIKVILSVITFGLIVLTINLMNYPSDVLYIVYLFGVYTILTSFSQMLMSIFQAVEKMEYMAAVTTIEKLILTILGLYILFLGYDLIDLAYVYILSSVISVIISFFIVLKKISKPLPKINFPIWKTITISSVPFGLNLLFGMLFFKIDTVLLSVLQNDVAVGLYNAAYNPLLALGTIISGMVVSAIYPVMSRNFISSKDSLGRFTVLNSRYMAIIGFPIAIGAFILADRFIELFYANQYTGSIIAFQILALFIPIRLISSITGTLLTSINRQGIRMISVLLSAIFNILLNLALIPSLSYVGASIATVLSEIFLYFTFIYFTNKYYHKLRLHNHFLKPLMASLIMGIIIFYLKGINLFLLFIMASLIYLSVLILLKTFNNEDKILFKQIFGRS